MIIRKQSSNFQLPQKVTIQVLYYLLIIETVTGASSSTMLSLPEAETSKSGSVTVT